MTFFSLIVISHQNVARYQKWYVTAARFVTLARCELSAIQQLECVKSLFKSTVVAEWLTTHRAPRLWNAPRETHNFWYLATFFEKLRKKAQWRIDERILGGSRIRTDPKSLLIPNPYGSWIRTDFKSVPIRDPYGFRIRTDSGKKIQKMSKNQNG